jgi:hypothetical protein
MVLLYNRRTIIPVLVALLLVLLIPLTIVLPPHIGARSNTGNGEHPSLLCHKAIGKGDFPPPPAVYPVDDSYDGSPLDTISGKAR